MTCTWELYPQNVYHHHHIMVKFSHNCHTHLWKGHSLMTCTWQIHPQNVHPHHHIMVKSFSQLPHLPMKGPIPHDMELLPRTSQPAFNSWGFSLRQITVALYHCVCWQNKLLILSRLDILADSCIFYALLLDSVWMGCIGIGIRFGWSFHNNLIYSSLNCIQTLSFNMFPTHHFARPQALLFFSPVNISWSKHLNRGIS